MYRVIAKKIAESRSGRRICCSKSPYPEPQPSSHRIITREEVSFDASKSIPRPPAGSDRKWTAGWTAVRGLLRTREGVGRTVRDAGSGAPPQPVDRGPARAVVCARVPTAARRREPGVRERGRHLFGLFRPPRRGKDLPLRPDPSAGGGRGVGSDRSGLGATHPGSQLVPARYLSLPAHPPRRRDPGGVGSEFARLPTRDGWLRPAGGAVPSRRGDRLGPRPLRSVLRPRRQRPMPVGRQLRAGKPNCDEEGLPGVVPGLPCPPCRGLPPAPARCLVVGRPQWGQRPAVRRPVVPGALQLRLFRAQLPDAPHGD